jgi:ketosteroid isomerase-like protein
MSQESVEIVRAAWDAWLRRDMDALAEYFDPDIVYDLTHFREWPDPIARGSEAVRRLQTEWLEVWDALEAGVDEFLAAREGRVVVLTWQRGRGRQSGLPMEFDWTLIVTVRDGKLTRGDAYDDRSQALEAAGLSE